MALIGFPVLSIRCMARCQIIQRQVSALHRGPDRDGELALTAVAVEYARTAADRCSLVDRSALGAHGTVRPADPLHVRAAGFIGVEGPHEVGQVPFRLTGAALLAI